MPGASEGSGKIEHQDVVAEPLLDALESGSAQPVPQPREGRGLAPKLTAEDARVRWDVPALAVDRRIRGCTPAPGAWSTLRGERIKLGPVEPVEGPGPGAGEIVASRGEVLVGTANGAVRLGQVQPPGKRPMPAADWARGARIAAGERFDAEGQR